MRSRGNAGITRQLTIPEIRRRASHTRYNRSWKGKLYQIRRGAVRRNITYELPELYAYTLYNQACFYCNQLRSRRGIDRVINTSGYIVGNCAGACTMCNNAKGEMSMIQFKQWITQVYSFIKD